MAPTESFDADLLARIVAVLEPGKTIATLGHGKPNLIGRIDFRGVEVTTERSGVRVGGAQLVPAWMFNLVWERLRSGEVVERDHVDRLAPGRKVKRSSAVFAVLALLEEVTVVRERPLAIQLVADA